MVVQEGILVIDNGSHTCRAGWAHDQIKGPDLSIRNIVIKGRSRNEGNVFTMVGDVDPQVLIGLDTSRGPIKSPFESNVVCNFETQETIFDFIFDRLGVEGGHVKHEIVLTECVHNPIASRQGMAELLFESYGCPALHMGPDCTFAYGWNFTKGIAKSDGIVVGMGHSSTNIVAFRDGKPDFECSCRINVGGLGLTNYMQRILELRYNTNLNNKEHPLAGFSVAEKMKEQMCYVSPCYSADLNAMKECSQDSHVRNEHKGELKELLAAFPNFNVDKAVEKIQVPELYFQPGMVGIKQGGVAESIAMVDKLYSQTHAVCKHLVNRSILLAGGGSEFQGMKERVGNELKSLSSRDSEIKILSSQDSLLDAWNGAAGYANNELLNKETYADSVNKTEYEEVGKDRIFVTDK